MTILDNWVVIGRFGRPHGIKGFISVHSFTQPRENLLTYTDWHAFINKQWQPIKALAIEVQNKGIIAKIEGYPERESVMRLTNVDIAVLQNKLPKLAEGDYYWHELIGMTVVNTKGESFGEVVELLATGSNDVLVVQGEKKHLIPYLMGQFILDINPAQKLITVDWDLDF